MPKLKSRKRLVSAEINVPKATQLPQMAASRIVSASIPERRTDERANGASTIAAIEKRDTA